MKIEAVVSASIMAVLMTGCMSVGEDGRILWGITKDRHPCSDTWSQADKNYELIVKVAEKSEVTGKITTHQLLDISGDAANYRSQAYDLCHAWHLEKINFDQYREAMAENNRHYEMIKDRLAKEEKSRTTKSSG